MRAVAHYILGALLVTASAYTPSKCEGGPLAADGCRVVAGHSAAVSRDLKHLLGRWLHIEGVGWRLAHDTMAARHRMSVDVAVKDRNSAREFGRQKVTVRITP